MNEQCLKITENAEKKMEKLYLSVTVEAIFIDMTLVGVLLYYLPWTTFTVLQAIGATLIILLFASIVLMLRKKTIRKHLISELEQNASSEAELKTYLEQNPLDFELIRPLFIAPIKR